MNNPTTPHSVEQETIELVRALAQSVNFDNDVGNTTVGVLVEPGAYVGFWVERIAAPVDGAPLLVHSSRREVAKAILERIDQ